jgi:hypothetical protein
MAEDEWGLSMAELDAWLVAYKFAWENRDAVTLIELFSEDAHYFATPFADAVRGSDGIAEYWKKQTTDQRDIDFRYNCVAINGFVCVARWYARFALASTATRVESRGIFVLDFNRYGECSVLREWSHSA